jgi:hypothetical protein
MDTLEVEVLHSPDMAVDHAAYNRYVTPDTVAVEVCTFLQNLSFAVAREVFQEQEEYLVGLFCEL